MGTRQGIAICKDCEETKKGIDAGEFPITLEWMNKEELIKHIQQTHCPQCSGDNWELTDASEI